MSTFAVAAFHDPCLPAGADRVAAVVWVRAAGLGAEGVDVELALWTPASAAITALREVAPATADRLADCARVDDHTLQVQAGRWLDGVHELELEIALPAHGPGDELLATRIAVLAGGEQVAGARVVVTWAQAASDGEPPDAAAEPPDTAAVTPADLPTGASPEPRHTGTGSGGGGAGGAGPCAGCGELPEEGDRYCEACGRELRVLEVARRDGARGEGGLREPGALLVLRQLGQAEAVEQGAQLRLDGVDREEDLVGDLLVRRGQRGRRVVERPAERDEDLVLGRRERDRRRAHVTVRGLGLRRPGIAEEQLRRAEAQPVALAQPLAPYDTLAVDVGPVARQPVVDERPLVTDELEQRMRARHLDVPTQRDVRLGLAPHGQPPPVARQDEDELASVFAAAGQKRLAAALGRDERLHVGGAAGRRLRARLVVSHRPDSCPGTVAVSRALEQGRDRADPLACRGDATIARRCPSYSRCAKSPTLFIAR